MCRHNHTGMQECRNRLLQGCTQESPCFWCHPVTFKVTVVDKSSLNLALKGCCPGGSTRLRGGGQPGQAMLSVLLRCSGPCLGLRAAPIQSNPRLLQGLQRPTPHHSETVPRAPTAANHGYRRTRAQEASSQAPFLSSI